MSINGLDCSNFYGYIAQSWANEAVTAGIQRATVRASLERPSFVDIAIHQIGAFRNAGADVDGYVWCYQRADNPDTLATRFETTYGTLNLPRVWLDLEDEDGWSYDDPAANIDWLHRALAGFDTLGIPAGIYTGRWYWVKPNRYANTGAFADRLLWTSDFDLNPDLGVWHAYGGWDQAHLAGKQWCGESSGPQANVAGVNVDRSVWSEALVPLPGREDEDMALVAYLAGVAADDVLPNIQRAIGQIDTALATPKLPAAARKALATARENLDAGARPAAETISRGGSPPEA